MLLTLRNGILGAVATATVATFGFLTVDYFADTACLQAQKMLADDEWSSALAESQKKVIAAELTREVLVCLKR